MSPSETLKPAKSIVASLGIGTQALSSSISTNTPGSPRASITSVAKLTSGSTMKSVMRSRRLGNNHTRRDGICAVVEQALATQFPALHSGPLVQRLNDPVYRHKLAQFLADAAVAAVAFFLAFQFRFIDVTGGIPDRYWTLLWGAIGFVAIGKAILFTALGLNRKWWRYFWFGDSPLILRAVAIASAVLVVRSEEHTSE